MFTRKTKLGCYWDMWKRTFDFRGLCSMHDYRSALLVHILLIVLLSALTLVIPSPKGLLIPVGYGALTLIPFTALSVRRFHDAGWSGWWTVLVYFGVGVLLCLCIGISGFVRMNTAYAVYGPPPGGWETKPTENQEPYEEFYVVYGPAPE